MTIQQKRILVVAPYAIWTPHLETDLEIIQNHLDNGDEVTVLSCNASMVSCDPNFDHKITTCLDCIGRRKAGMAKLSKSIIIHPILNLSKKDKDELKEIKIEYYYVDELKSAYVENFDIGWAVLSTLVSHLRVPDPDLSDTLNKQSLKNYIQNSLAVYRSIRNYLNAGNYGTVYVFNGRFAILRAVFRAAQKEGVQCFTHDRGCDFNHYELFENSLPHDMKKMEERMRRDWKLADTMKREEIASQFFEERSGGIKQNWISFTEDQAIGSLPVDWDTDKENIVIFTSSEDEFVAIGDEWSNSLYESQLDALKKIIPDISVQRNIRVYVRMHPNLKNITNSHVEGILALKADNLSIISPDSLIDSYMLLRNASKVLTFGSTIGIEAVYWGKPSILVGVSFYKALGGTYNPGTHEDVVKLLLKGNLPPKTKEPALMYGFYQKTRGIRFKYFEGIDVWEGRFKGVEIVPSLLFRRLKKYLSGWGELLKGISIKINRYKMGVD